MTRNGKRETGQGGASGCDELVDKAGSEQAVADCPNVLPIAEIGASLRRDADKNESGGQGTRTLNRQSRHLISNQTPNQFGYPPCEVFYHYVRQAAQQGGSPGGVQESWNRAHLNNRQFFRIAVVGPHNRQGPLGNMTNGMTVPRQHLPQLMTRTNGIRLQPDFASFACCKGVTRIPWNTPFDDRSNPCARSASPRMLFAFNFTQRHGRRKSGTLIYGEIYRNIPRCHSR